MKGRAMTTEFHTTLPAEYWEIDGSIYGALADKLSADGLIISSVRDLPPGNKLNVRIFYANEYELDSITVATGIVSKDLKIAEDWKGYKYQLQFVQISEQDRLKLKDLVNDRSTPEHISEVQDRIADGSCHTEGVFPSLPDSDLTAVQRVHCKSYENGKCLKTQAFCDLCQTADEIVVSEAKSSAKKSRSRGASPFTSVLGKLAENFKSAFRNH